jgi:hypothetical protein
MFPIPFLASLPISKTEKDIPELKFGLKDGLYKMANAEELMADIPFIPQKNNLIRRRKVKINEIIDGSQGSFTGEGILNEIKTQVLSVYMVTESENSKKVKIVNDFESRDL